ncbi:preprotein translocase subunit SecG [Candidatus Gracilibacteria bacterium]|nr:preprotein translocase subunit SecG [Candidatus Gracilibacteria bacterium]
MIAFMQIAEIALSIALIAVVLVQNKNVSLNLSSMSGGMGSVTKRGGEKLLHNTTIFLGSLFILNSLLLFVMS